jgi:hypothetical protein
MGGESKMDGFEAFFIIGILCLLYFLPTFVAIERKHPNTPPIFLLNLFFGWTLIGWVWALCWALMKQNKN